LAARLANGISAAAEAADVPLHVQRVGSMLTPFFVDAPVRDEASARRSDTDRYARFLHRLLEQGVYAPPSQFEAWFVSLAHTDADIDAALTAVARAVVEIR